ncbi:hypothetical protein [Lysobacter niastensis]|uniref:Uncharacterized protein n=1 Tax=Lysobacter niastensis TaxID=380629 RepID=A0ABS0BCD1_9GAMM|nr:hypothetical protein [Lysobacter niastensis]MBF6025354.1 hypothetical protein [Lysobacter niastensis]
MTTQVSERISLYLAQPACDDEDEFATQRAENEGMPSLVPKSVANPNLFDRVSMRLRSGLAWFTKEQELTLEQLLADIKAMSLIDARIGKQSASLMFLMASDIRDAKHFSIDSSLSARSMRAWRQRYNGLERFLR